MIRVLPRSRMFCTSLFTRRRNLCNAVSNGSHRTWSMTTLPFVPQLTIPISRRDAMKLCSQCEFIYEDDQERCDMDGAELVYEPTLEHTFPTALEAKSERERPARLIIPLTRSPQPETSVAPPLVYARSNTFALPIAAGIVLAVVAFVAFYASPRLFHGRAQTSNSTLETHNAKIETSPSSDRE